MKFGVVVFPGSNCDHDAFYAVSKNAGYQAEYIWHKENKINNDIDCIILPGGFSYGDYLRCGAIARFSPVMNEVVKFSERGGYVIGICNGFQILTETRLLPGILLQNKNQKFISKNINLRVENVNTIFTNKFALNEIISIPIAHGEGNYYANENVIKELEDNGRVVFRYTDENGNENEKSNPNGSINNIAGIISENSRVLGMMPHPERYCDAALGSNVGINVFHSIAEKFIK